MEDGYMEQDLEYLTLDNASRHGVEDERSVC